MSQSNLVDVIRHNAGRLLEITKELRQIDKMILNDYDLAEENASRINDLIQEYDKLCQRLKIQLESYFEHAKQNNLIPDFLLHKLYRKFVLPETGGKSGN